MKASRVFLSSTQVVPEAARCHTPYSKFFPNKLESMREESIFLKYLGIEESGN